MADPNGNRLLDECPKCGVKTCKSAESRFCIECGADLLIPTLFRYCKQCGEEIQGESNSCSKCRKKLVLKWLATAVAVLAIAAIGLLAIRSGSVPVADITYTLTCFDEGTGEILGSPEEGGGSDGSSITRIAPTIDGYEISYSKADGVTRKGAAASEVTVKLDSSKKTDLAIEFYYKKAPNESDELSRNANGRSTNSTDLNSKVKPRNATVQFGRSQRYEGKMYVGNLRTIGGPKRVTSIPDSEEPPVSAMQFLFVDGFYYYVEDFKGNGSGSVKLHKINLSTGQDSVLADDVSSSSSVFYEDGVIAFESYAAGKSTGLSILDVDSGEETKLVDGWIGLYGLEQGNCYAIDRHDTKYGITVKRYSIKGGKPDSCIKLEDGAGLFGMYDGVILTMKDSDCIAFDTDGRQLWTSVISTGSWYPHKAFCANGRLYFVMGPYVTTNDNREEPECIGSISLANGALDKYQTNLPDIMAIIYADENEVYFCGEEDGSFETAVDETFGTYGCSIADGKIVKLGDEVMF